MDAILPAPATRRSVSPTWLRFKDALRRHPTAIAGAVVLLLMIGVALLAPWLGTIDPLALSPIKRLKPPSAEYWFGTDMIGRDVYSRVIYGTRVSLTVGLTVALLATVIGLAIGLVTGYLRWLDAVMMRVMDGLMSIPSVLLAIALISLTKASLQNVIIAIAITEVPRVVRLVRSLVLTLREQPYVEAAVASGTRLPRDPAAPHPAQHGRAAAGAGHLHLRLGHDHRGHPVLHRRGHAAQHPELGQHHGRGAQPDPGGGNDPAVPGAVPVDHGAVGQPARRRHARRPRPAPGAADVKMADTQPLLRVDGLKTHFHTRDGVVRAVDGVSFDVMPGETLAIVGESGCGKSVTAMSILRLLPIPPARMAGGRIEFDGRNLLDLSEPEMRTVRGNLISMIFQEPMTSLNPVLTIGRQVAEVLQLHRGLSEREAMAQAIEGLRKVQISDAERRTRQYPHELSGGMRQRVMIAMALACGPRLLIADEPTTALDVTIQAQILDLMRKLGAETGASIILITHDLGVVAEMAQRVVVMYAGRKVEEASVEALFAAPRHPYTRGLLGSMPHLGQSLSDDEDAPRQRLVEIPGMVPSLKDATPGCLFAPRCDSASAQCRSEVPTDAGPWLWPLGRLLAPDQRTIQDHDGPRDAARMTAHPASTHLLLDVQGARKHFATEQGWFGRSSGKVQAVDGVSFTIAAGETLGLVGESGCGKSTIGKLILRLLEPTAGRILWRGQAIEGLSQAQMRPVRRELQAVFQDPYSSLNPRIRAADIVAEPLRNFETMTDAVAHERIAALFERVGLRAGPDGQVSVRVLRRPAPASRHRARAVGAARS